MEEEEEEEEEEEKKKRTKGKIEGGKSSQWIKKHKNTGFLYMEGLKREE